MAEQVSPRAMTASHFGSTKATLSLRTAGEESFRMATSA